MTYGRTFQADANAQAQWLEEPITQGHEKQIGETGAQGIGEELRRDKKPDRGGPHAKKLAPLKNFGKFTLEAMRKTDCRRVNWSREDSQETTGAICMKNDKGRN